MPSADTSSYMVKSAGARDTAMSALDWIVAVLLALMALMVWWIVIVASIEELKSNDERD